MFQQSSVVSQPWSTNSTSSKEDFGDNEATFVVGSSDKSDSKESDGIKDGDSAVGESQNLLIFSHEACLTCFYSRRVNSARTVSSHLSDKEIFKEMFKAFMLQYNMY